MRSREDFVRGNIESLWNMREPNPQDSETVQLAVQDFIRFPWGITRVLCDNNRWIGIDHGKLSSACLETWQQLGILHGRTIHVLHDRPDLGMMPMDFVDNWVSADQQGVLPRAVLGQICETVAAVFRQVPQFGFNDDLVRPKVLSAAAERIEALGSWIEQLLGCRPELISFLGSEADKLRRSRMLNILRTAFAPDGD